MISPEDRGEMGIYERDTLCRLIAAGLNLPISAAKIVGRRGDRPETSFLAGMTREAVVALDVPYLA